MNSRCRAVLLVLGLFSIAGSVLAQPTRRGVRPGVQTTATQSAPAFPAAGAAGQPETRPEDLARMEGTWLGVVHRYPTLIYVEMTLTRGARGLEGALKFQPFTERWAGGSIDTSLQSGSGAVSVVFNGAADTFRLAVQRAAAGSRFDVSGALSGAQGVLDLKNGMLSGRDVTRQDFFVFARPDKFAAIDKSFRTFRDESPAAAGRGFGGVFGSGSKPGRDEMLRWLEPFAREFPGVDPYRTAHGPLEMKAINLFEDEHFAATFGKRFDALSQSELNAVWFGYRSAGTDRPGQALAVFSGMFQTVIGTHNAKQTTLWVLAHRALRSWRRAQLDKLAHLDAGDTAFARIQAISDQFTAHLKDTLWPSEERQGVEAVATARRTFAQPSLEQKMLALESAAPDRATLTAAANWMQAEATLLAQVEPAARENFQRRAAAQLARVAEAQMPAEKAKVAALGSGLSAVVAGKAWHAAFSREFQPVLNQPAAQAVVAEFRQRRNADLAAAAPEMEAAIRAAHAKVPADISAAGDQARLAFSNDLAQRLDTWFGVPGDNTAPAATRINALAQQLGSEARNHLPPAKRGQVRYAAPTRHAPATEREKATVSWDTIARASRVGDNPTDALRLPVPITDPGFDFTTDICWAIFHGRFDQIRTATGKAGGIGTQMTATIRDTNPHFHYAFVTYVGLASAKYGERQFGPSTELFWETYSVNRNTGERTKTSSEKKNPVRISENLKEHYEGSYKIAEGAANADGTFGTSGNPLGFFQTYANLMQNGLLSQAGRRADGSMAFVQAGWERPIMTDIATLLQTWPDRSQGVWQFHENLRRYLEKQRSLQELVAVAIGQKSWTRLHLAAHRDHAEGIPALASTKAAANAPDRDGNTPLHLAVLAGNRAATTALLRAGADANARNSGRKTPLHFAVLSDETAGVPTMIHLLLSSGAVVDAPDQNGETALHYSAAIGFVPAMQALIKGGANRALADQSGRTPLHAALRLDRAEALQPLLQGGGLDLRAKDSSGSTVLHAAAAANAKQLIGELIAKGADVNAANDRGQTPLHVAAAQNSTAAIDALIIRGANLQAKDSAGRIPLDQAIASNKEAAILAIRKHSTGRP